MRVYYSEEAQIFHVSRFGFKFDGLVANTEDMVSFIRERSKKTGAGEDDDFDFSENAINLDDVSVINFHYHCHHFCYIITSPVFHVGFWGNRKFSM